MGVTNPDNAIVCPVMQRFLKTIEVLPAEDFPTHCPVIKTLQTFEPQPMRPRLVMPKTFMDFELTCDDLEIAATTMKQETVLNLEHLGHHVEEVVHVALQQRAETGNHKGGPTFLSKGYRGRCRPREPVASPYPVAAKPGRHGEFSAPEEVTMFGARSRIKQFRRIQSLLCQLKAHRDDTQERWYRTQASLHREWKTILQSRAYGPPFHRWLAEHPDIGFAQWPLPTEEWLHHVKQLVKFELDAHLAADRIMESKMRAIAQRDDKKAGSKASFAYVKHNANPPYRN